MTSATLTVLFTDLVGSTELMAMTTRRGSKAVFFSGKDAGDVV